jgi:protein-ribulosamine 3-kinase
MDRAIKDHIAYLLCINLERVRPIGGGDISKAYLLESDSERFFCKVNSSPNALAMFQAEKVGLDTLSKAMATPKVLLCEALEVGALLVMAHIPSKPATMADMQALGRHLARLHAPDNEKYFGFATDNFIGSLPQSNRAHGRWADFYVRERLLPQLQMARDTQKLSPTEMPSETKLIKVCENLLPNGAPSLLHGDLWAGNYLISEHHGPVLIDPAVFYGHHEVDLAMTRLFGGFSAPFYDAYHEIWPRASDMGARLQLYQLYYLLVHLNLFGITYQSAVRNTINHYF